MSTHGPSNGVDLVTTMFSRNLQSFWMDFDSVKHVKNWTIFAANIYEAAMHSMMTIAICDMKAKVIKS